MPAVEQAVEQRDRNAANIEVVRQSARLNAPDRFYAALFAPASVRDDLIALAAFSGEIGRIADHVSEAALGEIRIAWWRDTLLVREDNGLSGNPVLDAFADVARRHRLPLDRIEGFLSAHADALYPGAPADDGAFDSSMANIDGTPFEFAAQILGADVGPNTAELFHAAARAYGLARIGLELPRSIMRGCLPLPEAHAPATGAFPEMQDWRPQIAWLADEGHRAMSEVRRHLAEKPCVFATALLPLALVEPYFRALQDPRHAPTRDLVEIAPLARLWRIGRAHWSGRI
jgi:phytoene synthase